MTPVYGGAAGSRAPLYAKYGDETILLPAFGDVVAAQKRIHGRVRVTPLNYSNGLSKLTGLDLFLKMENTQVTGSYKERGAVNNLVQLSPEERKNGVVLASAGNHAQAVAFHASQLGIDAKIVMPTNTPIAKIWGTKRWGGTILLHGESFDDAAAEAMRICREEQRLYVHAFDRFNTIAGQGTLGLELYDQCPDLDAVLVPIGGGGLIAGVSMVLKELNTNIKVYGVEADSMQSALISKRSSTITEVPFRQTLADGIAVKKIGHLTFPYVEKFVDDIVTVSENEISLGILRLLQYEKTLAEGSGATGLAAVLANKVPELVGKRVALVLTGGNIDLTILGKIIERGLVLDGRISRVIVTMYDRPGSLASVLNCVASLQGNIRQVEHERAFMDMDTPIGFVTTLVEFESRSFEHVLEVVQGLKVLPCVVKCDVQNPVPAEREPI